SRSSKRGLDWFAFFVADIQTGFGPFLSVYLTTQKWTQVDIGLVLSIGSLASLLGQVPGGWLVDRVRSKRRMAAFAVLGIGVSALLIALTPVFATIAAAKLLHVAASSVLGPAVAAITLGLVGHASVGPRLGRNARFAATGNVLAAGVMGACGYFVSAQAGVFLTALPAMPALLALRQSREDGGAAPRAGRGLGASATNQRAASLGRFVRRPGLIVLVGCVLLFHLANAAMLPLVGTDVTARSGRWATVLVAACIIAPQGIVAVVSPSVGQLAQT